MTRNKHISVLSMWLIKLTSIFRIARNWIMCDRQHKHQKAINVSAHFNPALWFVLCVEGANQGILLVNSHPDEQCCELVYFGLIPTAWGQSQGKDMIVHQASLLDYHSLFLAVDKQNEPAIRLYKKMGFQQTIARIVCAKVLQKSS